MKRLKYLAAAAVLCITSVFATSCGGTKLAAPTEVTYNVNNVLIWNEVSNARSYLIEWTNVATGETNSRTSRKNNYSLDNLEEGDYNIKIKAVGNGNNLKDSDWTSTIAFHKDYETGCVYTLINNGTEYELSGVGKASGEIVLEDVYRGKPVTSIKQSAFKGSGKITSVTIGSNTKTIGKNAFYNCVKIEKIVVPDSVTTIGESAFQSCRALTSITLPSKLDFIDENLFAYCRELPEITIPDTVTTISEKAFYGCTALGSIVIPDSVTTIGKEAFASNTSLSSISFGKAGDNVAPGIETISERAFELDSALKIVDLSEAENLTYIGTRAFASCSAVSEAKLPEGLEEIDDGAFYGDAALMQINMPSTLTSVGMSVFNETGMINADLANGEEIVYVGDWLVGITVNLAYNFDEEGNEIEGDLKEIALSVKEGSEGVYALKKGTRGIADGAFRYCNALESVTLPNSVEYIGDYSFASNDKLYKVVNNDGSKLKKIGIGAFSRNPILSNVRFCDGLEEIDSYAFYGCTVLQNNEFNPTYLVPDSVKRIGEYAFKNTALWEKPNESGVIYAGNWVVGASDRIRSAVLNEGTVGVADYAFYKSGVRSVSGLEQARYVGKGAFYVCENLERVVLNSNITEIKDYTFYKCTSLHDVAFPSMLQTIGRSAFYGCTSLTELDLSDTELESIGMYAFCMNSNLTSIKFGNDLKYIGDYAFYKNISLASLTLPDSLDSVSRMAFYNCTALESLDLGKGVEEIGYYSFGKCSALKSITVPGNVKTIGDYAFSKCTEVKSLVLGNGIENIGKYAFWGLTKVANIYLPSSLNSIGDYAFMGIKSYEEPVIDENGETVKDENGQTVMKHYDGLASVTISKNIASIGAHAFTQCSDATFYTDATEYPEEWNTRWNMSYRPVIKGCVLSSDGSYVVSVTITENTVENGKRENLTIAAPEREGYKFVGWTTVADSVTAEYTAAQITEVEAGTTLYAIWAVATVNE